MKTQLYYISILLAVVNGITPTGKIYAQTPQTPRINFVSIDAVHNKPIIQWTVDEPQALKGYIVKRYIYDFQNTYGYNTIAVIDDPYTMEYIDLSETYGEALPEKRSEIYRIAAFDSIEGERHLSPMSPAHGTIHLSGSFNYCARQNLLIWNQYQSPNHNTVQYTIYGSYSDNDFQIIAQTNYADTTFSANAETLNANFQYYLTAETNTGFISRSNTAEIISETSDFPENLYISKISNADNTLSKIEFYAEFSEAAEKYALIMNQSEESTWLFEPSTDGTYQIEIPRNPDALNRTFTVSALDSCPAEIAGSLPYSDLIITAEEKPENIIKLTAIQQDESHTYNLYRSFNDAPFEIVATNISTSYNDDVSENLIAQLTGELPQGYYKYRFETKDHQTLYISNTAYILHKPKIIKYNAINPLSTYKQDNEFKPFTAYLKNYQMTIYSPAGNIIFETNNPQKAWKGKLPSGEVAPRGSYIYYIRYTDSRGNIHTEKDFVTVVY